MSQLTLLLLEALAAYRLWRLMGEDTAPFLKGPRDALFRRLGPRSSWIELIVCPWCLGSWTAFVVVAVTAQVIDVQLPVLHGLAVATLVGFLGEVDGRLT